MNTTPARKLSYGEGKLAVKNKIQLTSDDISRNLKMSQYIRSQRTGQHKYSTTNNQYANQYVTGAPSTKEGKEVQRPKFLMADQVPNAYQGYNKRSNMPSGTSPYKNKKDYPRVMTATGSRSFASTAGVQVQGYLKNADSGAGSGGQPPSLPAPSSPYDMKHTKLGSQYDKTPQPKVGKMALVKAHHAEDMRKSLYSHERKELKMTPQRAAKNFTY